MYRPLRKINVSVTHGVVSAANRRYQAASSYYAPGLLTKKYNDVGLGFYKRKRNLRYKEPYFIRVVTLRGYRPEFLWNGNN